MTIKGNILMLYGYDKIFAHSIIKRGFSGTMDVIIMKNLFEGNGYKVEISTFSELDINRDFTEWFVIYASSEEKGLFYKDYIEDVLLSIQMRGGILLPDFKYFRAHHNKSFSEMLRYTFKEKELKTITSKAIGSIKELETYKDKIKYPVMLKASAGCSSNGVKLVRNYDELINSAKKLNRLIYFDFWFNIINFNSLTIRTKNLVKRILGRQFFKYSPLYSNKFIIQDFVKDLSGDYKVLVFGDKYYILRRQNRDRGFTASGSGKFIFPEDTSEIVNILDFAKKAHEELNTPISSIDIGENKEGCHLIEYQCLFFGPFTIQFSPCYFIKKNNQWVKIEGKSNLESEYCRSIDMYICNYLNK